MKHKRESRVDGEFGNRRRLMVRTHLSDSAWIAGKETLWQWTRSRQEMHTYSRNE